MARNPLDEQKSVNWAIADCGGGGMFGFFDLVNLDNGRAHRLVIRSKDVIPTMIPTQIGLIVNEIEYMQFKTARPLSFEDIHDSFAVTGGQAWGFVVGLSETRLQVWKWGGIIFNLQMGGAGWGLAAGASLKFGFINVQFDDSGTAMGNYRRDLEIPVLNVPDPTIPPPPPIYNLKVAPQENPILNLNADILFDFDKYIIKPTAVKYLEELAKFLNRYPDLRRNVIMGHTDSKGSDIYNLTLSTQRALEIKNWLVRNRVINAENFITIGVGSTKPVAPNKQSNGRDNPSGRQKNRRVEICIGTKYS